MILIGSRALALRAPSLLSKAPVDFDFVCTQDEYQTWMEKNSHKINPTKIYPIKDGAKMIVEGDTNIEFEMIQPGTSTEMLDNLVSSDKDTFETPFGLVPSFDMLFTLKSSHKHLKNNPHFWKTLSDYHKMKDVGAVIRPEYKEFYKLREKETYNYSHPKLNTDKKNFFKDDAIVYTYDHDSLHQAVKHLDKPAYVYFGKEGQEVLSDKKKFFECPLETQLYSVVEESAVLAVERSLVPHPGVLTIKQAWGLAFSKVLTSITSGWWRSWAYDHAFEALKLYPEDYFEKFQKGLENGVVKPFTGSTY